MKVDECESLHKEQLLVKYTPEKNQVLRYLSWYTSKKIPLIFPKQKRQGKIIRKKTIIIVPKADSFKNQYICDYLFLCKQQKSPLLELLVEIVTE